MDDTPENVKQLYNEMLMSKSPAERFKMAGRMFDAAKKLVIAGIFKERPDIGESQLRAEIFLRMYGNDFSPVERDRIVQKISGAEPY
jgi:hypothetical protein